MHADVLRDAIYTHPGPIEAFNEVLGAIGREPELATTP
jgi:hypothetical protein